jgi:glycosyltransferase involved in cell wall biosynthesis
VIISDRVNIYKEILAGGVGAVVPTQVDPLADELSRWMGDEALRRRAGAAGPEFVRSRYDWDRIARRWADHYDALAGKKV